MRTVSALDVRKKFGQVLDEAAAGERIVIERAGRPVAALVPLEDLAALDPATVRQRRLAALEDLRRMARAHPVPRPDAAELVRASRRERDAQIMTAVREGRAARRSGAQDPGEAPDADAPSDRGDRRDR